MDLCKVTAIGHIQPRDPEPRFTADGRPILQFRMVSNRKRRGKDGDMVDEAVWLQVTVMGPSAESLSTMLAKGSHVYVDGRLSSREWTDNEGQKRTSLEVFATDVILLGGRAEAPAPSAAVDEMDLPF